MKKNILLNSIILCCVLVTFSCQEQEENRNQKEDGIQVSFKFSNKEFAASNLKVLTNDLDSLIISITDDADTPVITQKALSIFNFGEGYISEPIVLTSGDFVLTEFLVIGGVEVKYATPIEGSELAHLVSETLPISFSVTEDAFNSLQLEVVTVDGSTAADFGYSSFGFDIINVLNVFVSTIIRDESPQGFSFTASNIAISGDGNEIYADTLLPQFNLILLDTINESTGNGYDNYIVSLSKLGFSSFEQSYTKQEFAAFNETPLSVTLDSIMVTQVGQTVFGTNAEDWLNGGRLNNDGNIFIGGTRRRNDPNDGYVRIYEEIGGVWQQLGSDITKPGFNFGATFEINGAGDIVLVSDSEWVGTNGAAGAAFVYEYNGADWVQLGQTLEGDVAGDVFGQDIAINDEGNVIAIGAWENDGGGTSNGQVKVFQNVSGTWVQVGQTLNGGFGDRLGTSVALNSEGNILASSAWTGGITANDAGEVFVYENVGGTWVQIGQSLAGDQSGESFGFSLALNAAGDIMLAGSPTKDINGDNQVGQVQVYQNVGGSWVQMGQTLTGEVAEEGFSWYAGELNDAGDIMSVPSRINPNESLNTDRVQIFQFNGAIWERIAQVSGGSTTTALGGMAGLNAAGDRVAVGNLFYDDGAVANSGAVLVFDVK